MATNYVFNDKKIYGAAAVIPKYSKFAPLSRRFVSTLMPRLSPLFLVTIAVITTMLSILSIYCLIEATLPYSNYNYVLSTLARMGSSRVVVIPIQ
ncbi:transmembrane protein, putative [Medicago truncatula]|uniref:Transmembrane protein, putative n=1 Tax=Medicago truncatula TaxID=3880 RepID=G7K3S1_MEDTR|nr:transmembrane protein, putative [Medicago truncatula]